MSADTKRCVEVRRSDCSNPAIGGGVAVESFSFDSSDNVLGDYDGSGNPLATSALGNHYLFQGREYSWARIRRGWHDGGESFRDQLMERLNLALQKGQRGSYGGDAVREHDTAEAERWVRAGMKALRVTEDDLRVMRMNCAAKVALAWMVRRRTAIRNAWIKERLQMGTATSLSARLKKLETSRRCEWGYDEYKTIRILIIGPTPFPRTC